MLSSSLHTITFIVLKDIRDNIKSKVKKRISEKQIFQHLTAKKSLYASLKSIKYGMNYFFSIVQAIINFKCAG